MFNNRVVKTFEKDGGTMARYASLTHRTANKKFGPNFKQNLANWYFPMTDADISNANRSEKLQKFAAHLGKAKNNRYLVTAKMYGWPLSYDPVVAQMHNRPDLVESNKFLPPNCKVDILITIGEATAGLRSLAADDTADAAARQALWTAKNPKLIIDKLFMYVRKVKFPEGSPFNAKLEQKRKTDTLIFGFTSPNEIRDNLQHNHGDASLRVMLQQIGYPILMYIYWMRSANVEGTGGYNKNASVFKAVPNLATLNIKFGTQCLMHHGEELPKLSQPSLDTAEKYAVMKKQSMMRREPDEYSDFFDPASMQQFVVLDLQHVYAGKSPDEWNTLPPLDIFMVFTTDMCPEGWQIMVITVSEGQFCLEPTGAHYMLNAAGTRIEG